MAPRSERHVIDLSISDDEMKDTTVVASSSRRSLKRKAGDLDIEESQSRRIKSAKTQQPAPSRAAFRELSAKAYQRKLRGPIAWVMRGIHSKARDGSANKASGKAGKIKGTGSSEKQRVNDIRSFFGGRNDVVTMPKAQSSANEQILYELESSTPKSHRPQRQSTQRANAFQMMMMMKSADTESSEDELQLAVSARFSAKLSKTKKSKAAQEDDSEFSAGESGPSSADEDEDVSQDEPETPDSPVSSDESDAPPAKRKPRAKAKSAPKQASTPAVSVRVKSKSNGPTKMVKLISYAKGRGLNLSLPPLYEPKDIFKDLTDKALKKGFDKAVQHLGRRPLRVATMCSGTESPLLALEAIRESLDQTSGRLHFHHLFSAEIVPYKQAYIERNFAPETIFRDITELTKAVYDEEPKATTAYGAKVPIPREVDLLIAGTSCVDFSKLNNRAKSIEDVGESGDTWRAVLAYCQAFRPTIVILENVRDAAWEKMLDDYTDIGYETAGVFVDTKQYYLPQTRQRGYMVCFNKDGKDFKSGMGSHWSQLMEFFKRPASSPASSFLLPNDRVARPRIRNDDAQHEVDWARCEIRHMQYRHAHRLGFERPVTHWSESGAIQVPENGHTAWYKAQTERVWDLLDIAVLRKALPKNNFYDARYKTRIWDVSQNVDRDQDHVAFGISGCITPRGIFFLSDAGRTFAPEETLKMQGLPLNKISFTTEAPTEIQDLAGNAMSMPVIGAAILSALTAGYSIISQKDVSSDREMVMLSDTNVRGSDTIKTTTPPTARTCDISMPILLEKAGQSLRRCFCEGANGITTKQLQECLDCGHTSCTACGGNPAHNYRPRLSSSKRLAPGDFEDYVRQVMPLKLRFTKTLSFDNLPTEYANALSKAIDSSFALQSIRRTHCWTVLYVALDARLELVFDDNQAQWRLYSLPSKALPSDNALRSLLAQPVALATPKESPLEQDWQIRKPLALGKRFEVEISPSAATVASWWSRMGLPDFADHTVPEILNIELGKKASKLLPLDLNGKYEYMPYCGTACDSLFQKMDRDRGSKPVYLFLDPTGTGDPDDDCFVFSHNKARLEYDEVRVVLARIAAPWRPWTRPGHESTKPTLVIEDAWSNSDGLQLRASDVGLTITHPQDLKQLTTSTMCSMPYQLISCVVSGETNTAELQDIAREQAIAISGQDSDFFAKTSWIFEAMRRHLQHDQWSRLTLGDDDEPCHECAPIRPTLRWSLQGERDVKPYEDAAGAAEFERAMKRRPDPIKVVAAAESGEDSTRLSVDLNLATLAHRARSKLPQDTLVSGVQYDWRLLTVPRELPFVFKPFDLRSTADMPQDTDGAGLTVSLFPQQQQSLAWMQQQESGTDIEVSSIEESSVAALGWRAEVRARSTIRARGGICADHPGFGKTILSLALINSQLLSETQADIITTISGRYSGGLYASSATLVVCPQSLVKQWVEEIQEKIGLSTRVLAVSTVAGLNNFKLEDFKNAKIIVASRALLANDTYTERLAAFAAIPGPAVNSGRAFAQWREHAMNQVPAHLEVLRKGRYALQKHIQQTYQANMDSEDFKRAIPSRRLRGQNYVASKQKGQQAAKAAAKTIDTSTIDKPLFEMFHFNRIIVDEFHQCETKEYAAILDLSADKRWGLSGTPAMGDFYDISRMGQLLGIELPFGSMERGIMKAKNARELRNDMSSFELFDTMRRQLPSQSTYAEIHALHQRFLDTFVRQNIGDFSKLPYQDHLVPVSLDFEQSLLYTELSQHLNTLQMRIKKSRRSRATDRNHRLDEAVKDSKTAEQALCKAASFCDQQVAGNMTLLDELMASCRSGIDVQRDQVARAAAAARSSEPDKFQKWQSSRLQAGGFDDQELIDEVSDLIKTPASSKKTGKGESDATAQLQDACMRLLIERRSLRYLEKAMQLKDEAQNSIATTALCDSAACSNSSTDVAISALCGHAVCRDCYAALQKQAITHCCASGCASALHSHHLLWKSKMGNLHKDKVSAYGAKLDKAAKILLDIQRKKEQAILFVQFSKQLEQAALALEHYGITGIVVEKATEAGSQLAAFRESAGTEQQSTVIVLDASDETAAGSNLQNANHILFLSPLLRDTQYTYDATMAQAIGRVRRYGQQKEIHVYRLVALNTIDVDILEHRERRTTALVEQGSPAIEPPLAARELNLHSPPKPERTQLVRENGKFSLRPQSWLVRCGADEEEDEVEKVKGKRRVLGWEDFSSLVKFSEGYTEDDG